MDLVTGVTVFSHILTIKEKLFPNKKESASTEIDINININGVEIDKSKYCSLFVEHSYSYEKQSLELIIAKKGSFTISIRHLDWVIMDRHLDKITPINFAIPSLWQIEQEGGLLNIDFSNIQNSQIKYHKFTGKELKQAASSLKLQCTYADGFKQLLDAPQSLKLFVYNEHSKKKVESL